MIHTFILLLLVQSTLVTVQRGMTQFDEKPVAHLTSVMKDACYFLYLLQSSTGYAHNSRKSN